MQQSLALPLDSSRKSSSRGTECLYGNLDATGEEAECKSLSSFSMSELTPPISFHAPTPSVRLESLPEPDAEMPMPRLPPLGVAVVTSTQRSPRDRIAGGALDDRGDPFFMNMNRQRRQQYREELEDIFKEVVDRSHTDPLVSLGSYVTLIAACSWLISLACFLPLSNVNQAVFVGSKLEATLKDPLFEAILLFSVGCGVPKLVDLLYYVVQFNLDGLPGANFGLDILTLCNVVPHIIFFYLSLRGDSYEGLYICLGRWQMCGVGICALCFFAAHIPEHCSIFKYAITVNFYNIANVLYARANVSANYWEIIPSAQACFVLSGVFYVFFLYEFYSKVRALKLQLGPRLLSVNIYIGFLLNAVIIVSLICFHGGQFLLKTTRSRDFDLYTSSWHILTKTFVVVMLTFVPFHLGRMEKFRIKELLLYKLETRDDGIGLV